ncbi:MAG: trehalose-phosphatase [Streptosporangiales bacterium]|nr:trehalose-phosphatase [Streptosporangiales bacterium]
MTSASPSGRAGLDAVAADPAGALIASDFDGTLSAIVPEPSDARGYPGAADALAALAAKAGTVAIITGRPAADAVAFGGFAGVSGLIVLGHYGAERWQDGTVTAAPVPPGVAVVRDRLPGVLAAEGAADGVRIEDKGTALAVHTRQAADPAGEFERLREPVGRLAEQTGLTVEPGKFVLEIRPAGTDKGGTLKALVRERGARSVVFCGDDLGDLPAFDAIRGLRAEGVPGCAVASRSPESPQVADAADLVVEGPAGIVTFLRALCSRLPLLWQQVPRT